MTSAEPNTETEELSGSVLGIISSYGMDAALDARDLYPKTGAKAPPVVPADGHIGDVGLVADDGRVRHSVARPELGGNG